MDTEITRDEYTATDPNTGEEIEIRLYDLGGVKIPSVTTVLKLRDEDLSNLYDWQDRHDGKGDNAHHEHWFWYSRHRGTLAHYAALSNLDKSLEWGRDEASSQSELGVQRDEEVKNDTHREVLYSVVKYLGEVETWGEFYDKYEPYKNHPYYRKALKHRKDRDVAFFEEAFDRVRSKLDLDEENAIEVERFLFDEEHGYAGQCDMLLEYPDGSVALADLKTKKGAFMKEKMQVAAYAKAAERDDDIPVNEVDRLEVWCIHPDTGKWAIYSDDGGQSPLHTSKYWKKDYDELWSDFKDLVDRARSDIPDDIDDTETDSDPITFTTEDR